MTQQQHTTQSVLECRNIIRQYYLADEYQVISELLNRAQLSTQTRVDISTRAADLIRTVRHDSTPTMMEKFLAEYGLTTKEGVALMCLAEALLRVPDTITIDALIEDKVVPGDWNGHRGQSNSSLINTTTWGLMLAGKMINPLIKPGVIETMRGLIKRMGEPVVRTVAGQAMKEMGRQFVLGRTIEEAQKRGKKYQSKGYTYSFDMLGEAARTDSDAQRHHRAYSMAIEKLKPSCIYDDIRKNPGISGKLSALHSRYEFGQRDRVMDELMPRVLDLAKQAKAANMGFNIDAEEADRLDLSLDIIEAVLSDPELAGWDGFGVVVQALDKRASKVLDWLYALSVKLDRHIMVRLVKGAYWDAEIKHAQVMGLDGFPVFTRKACSDVSYISCAKKLLAMTDRIYPQFATHNAHSASAIMEMAPSIDCFEFQRLHGMGESLFEAVLASEQANCRIYAPVGEHKDLLAYLVRRLLENGSNSSFVNQIVDESITPEQIAQDPFVLIESLGQEVSSKKILPAKALFEAKRRNSKGWDLTHVVEVEKINEARNRFKQQQWQCLPLMAEDFTGTQVRNVINPAEPNDDVGQVIAAVAADADIAITSAVKGFESWSVRPAAQRAEIIERVGEVFEANAMELFTIATREAGKTLQDGIAEVREAVDFAYYYAGEATRLEGQAQARGVISCISPWNFPLAIFAGQILAALAAGNTVVAKPSRQTEIMAFRAVQLMHQAGVPIDAVQLLPGSGGVIGTAITSDPRIAGVCFTGSTDTAQHINKVMAENLSPKAPLVAETGGLNAMIVDSTALPEQVVKDVLASSFQSAGQRCSALRMLYVQKDIANHFLAMLYGAMDELSLGDPWLLSTDVGPVIDAASKVTIDAHCEKFAAKGQVMKQLTVPEQGYFVAPTVIRLNGIEELDEEIFGPVLHVATFEAQALDSVVDAINAKGFGLTFGLHTRVDSRIERITSRIKVGNMYVNRNQIGAIVGSQPFGGEGLSGTGPKAGGPHYVRRFMQADSTVTSVIKANAINSEQLQAAIAQVTEMDLLDVQARAVAVQRVFSDAPEALDAQPEFLPGPTGEVNRLTCHARGVVLCLGPDADSAMKQAKVALSQGNRVVVIVPNSREKLAAAQQAGLAIVSVDGQLQAEAITTVQGFHAIATSADEEILTAYRKALAKRTGTLLPLISEIELAERYIIERHFCMDTTAAGGNASLIAGSE